MKNSAVSANRDPIKRLPLRNPGQSIEDQIAKFRAETIDVWIVMLIFAVVLMLWEWYWYLIPIQSGPVPITLMCLGVIFYSVIRIRQERETLEQLKLGLKGEQATGQYLQNSLLRQGYWVVHDICFDDFNIDHALIGPAGVFAIETKTRSKPSGDSTVSFDGHAILIAGHKPDRDPIVQSTAAAKALQGKLLEYSGTKVSVRPVVLFPGWFVEKQPRDANVWVLNEKAFVKWIGREPDRLSRETSFQLAAALGRYVRDREANAS